MTVTENSLSVSLKALLGRYIKLNLTLGAPTHGQDAAPSGTEEENLSYKAYSVEPTIRKLGSARDKEYFLFYVTKHNLWKDCFWILFELAELSRRRKDQRHQRLATLLEFAINDRFSDLNLRKEAVLAGLQITQHSWYGNGIRKVQQVLKRINSRIRALQTAHVRRGLPQRPAERAEPTHEWLPSWEIQSYASPYEEPDEEHIADLLSPSEVLFHLKRLSA